MDQLIHVRNSFNILEMLEKYYRRRIYTEEKARKLINSIPQTAVTTFALSSVHIYPSIKITWRTVPLYAQSLSTCM